MARRVLALLHGSVSLGLGLSLPRYIAHARAVREDARGEIAGYLSGAGVLAILLIVGVGLALVTAPHGTAGLLFGESRYGALLVPLYLCLIGLLLHTLCYGYFRGHVHMTAAGTLQVVNQGALHLVPFVVPNLTAGGVLTIVGAGWIVTSGSTMGLIVTRGALRNVRWPVRSVGRYAKELFQYGVPRLPGDLTLVGLFTLPATLAAHVSGIEAAGYVAFGLSALSMLGSLFAPVGLVLLPDATRLAAQGRRDHLRRTVWFLLVAGVGLTTLGVLVVGLAAHHLVTWYLGPAYAGAVPVLRVLMLAAVPYSVYVLMRSVLDALSVRALNSRNLAMGLIVFGVVAVSSGTVSGVSFGVAAAMMVTALLTVRDARTLLRD